MTDHLNHQAIVAIDDAHAVTIVHALVEIPSLSGDEAVAVEQFVLFADRAGFETHIDEAGNGIATRAHSPAGESVSRIVLLGHIDTVPGLIPVRFDRNVLHGRGSVDAKGSLAAMLVAASRARVPDDVELVVIAAVGEETSGSPGARHIRDQYSPDFCIIGEPSGWDGVTLGYKGRLVLKAEHVRPLSHGAGPDGSASDVMLAWWNRIQTRLADDNLAHDRMFDHVQSTVESIQSTRDGLSDACVMTCGFRLPPSVSPDALSVLIHTMTPKGIVCEFEGAEVAHQSDRNDPVVRALSTAIRQHGGSPVPKLKTGTADLNVVGPAWQCPIAAYGPGDSRLDHTPNEHLHMNDYLRAIDVLTTAIETLTNGDRPDS